MDNASLSYLMSGIDSITNSFLNGAYPALANAVATPVYFLAIIYWALFGYGVYAGNTAFDWKDFLSKTAMTIAIFGMLNWHGLARTLYQFFLEFMNNSTATLIAGKPTTELVDAFFIHVQKISNTLSSVPWTAFGTLMQGGLLLIVNSMLFAIALCYMAIAKMGLAITMVLAPLFIAFVMFESTRQWFMNWLGTMFNFSLIYILVMTIVQVGFSGFGDLLKLAEKASALEAALITPYVVGQLLIMELILILFMLCVRGWAAQLSGAASSSSGGLMGLTRFALNKMRMR